MGFHSESYYVCDWCHARGAPAPQDGGFGTTQPDGWERIWGGDLLCGACSEENRRARERAKATCAARRGGR